MISDTLHDAVNEIDGYLNEPDGGGPYTATPLYAVIVYVRDVMEVLRCVLDADLDGNRPPARFHPDSTRTSMPPYDLSAAVERAKAEE